MNGRYGISKSSYVTGSGKTGLNIHDSRFDFSPRTQCYMNELSNFTTKSDLSGLLLLTTFPSTMAICMSGLDP